MEIILLERIAKLGQMGDKVRVRDGYARNFLLPQGKALRATEANRKRFESERAQLETRNLERRSEAEAVAVKLNGKSFVVIRQAGETGQLYGSVSTRDLAEIFETGGFNVGRSQIELTQPIKSIGLHTVSVALHPDVDSAVTINVARSEDEAERQFRGEDLTTGMIEEIEDQDEIETAGESDDADGADNDEEVSDGDETFTEDEPAETDARAATE